MKSKYVKFIMMVYVAASISIAGYFYINPIKIYEKDDWGNYVIRSGGKFFLENDYTNLKYSILISIVIGLLIYSIFILFKKDKE